MRCAEDGANDDEPKIGDVLCSKGVVATSLSSGIEKSAMLPKDCDR